jgi:hypothetical protein
VLSYMAEQAARAEQLEPQSVEAALWSVLSVLAANNGCLRSSSKAGRAKEQDTPGWATAPSLIWLTCTSATGRAWDPH